MEQDCCHYTFHNISVKLQLTKNTWLTAIFCSRFWITILTATLHRNVVKFIDIPEIRSVERGICPIATLYSLAAAFQRLTLLWACSQFCLWIKTVGCHDNRGLQRRNLHDTIAQPEPENRGKVKTACNRLLWEPSYSQFCPKICCHGNEGRQGRNLNHTIG